MTGDELRGAAELLAFFSLLSYSLGVSTDKLYRQPSWQRWSHPPGEGKQAPAPNTCPLAYTAATGKKINKQSRKTIKHEERQKEEFHSKTLNVFCFFLYIVRL